MRSVAVPPEHDGLGSGSAIYSITSFDRERVRPAVRTMSWRNSTVIGIVALAWGTTAFADTHEIHRGQLKSKRDATAVSSAAFDLTSKNLQRCLPRDCEGSARPSSTGEKENSAVLKFQMSNGSSSTLTDIVFEVSIVEELGAGTWIRRGGFSPVRSRYEGRLSSTQATRRLRDPPAQHLADVQVCRERSCSVVPIDRGLGP